MNILDANIGSAKDNMSSPVHNWYKFTAGFSYKFVDIILEDYAGQDIVVYEPFAGGFNTKFRMDMMNSTGVTPNISIVPSPGFGNPNYGIIVLFFYMVDSNMMSALELPLFSSKKCIVRHKMDNPMCSKEGDSHIIYISAHDNYWCKWVYQFAHEYCHHLIDGTLSGEWADLLWFEETICELSSIYNLYKMERFCSEVGLGYFSPSVEEYKENLLNKNAQLYNLSPSGGWYSGYASSLSEVGYKRDLYNAIAALMFPLFVENPRLWKIILHIGDIRSWNSLEDLFTHLQSKADDSYADSINQLRRMFS